MGAVCIGGAAVLVCLLCVLRVWYLLGALLALGVGAALSCNSYTFTKLENRHFFDRAVRSIRQGAAYARTYQLMHSKFVPIGWVVGARAQWFANIDVHSVTYYTWKWNPSPRYDEDEWSDGNGKDDNSAPYIVELTSAYEVSRTVAYLPPDLERVPLSMPIALRIVSKLLDAEQESGVESFGGVFVFNAPSGAGKTIAARCLARLLNATFVSNWDATQIEYFVHTALPSRERPLLLVIEDAEAIIHRIPNATIDAVKKYQNVILIISTSKSFAEIRDQKPVLLRPGRVDAVFNFEARGYIAENT